MKARLDHPGVFDDVHVVEPDILHAACEVLPSHQRLARLQEVINAAQVYLSMKKHMISQVFRLQVSLILFCSFDSH